MKNVMELIGMAILGFILLLMVVFTMTGGGKEKIPDQAYLEDNFDGHPE